MSKTETADNHVMNLNDLIELEEKGQLDQIEIEQFVENAKQIAFNLEPIKDSISEFVKSAEKVFDVTKNFTERYKDILTYVDTSDWEKAAGVTFEEMEEMSLRDVMERIRERHGVITPESEWATKNKLRSHNAILIPQTRQPKQFVMTKDKITNKFFEGALPVGSRDVLIGTEGRKSKKAVVSIDFEDLPHVFISKTITPYDREVHDAIVSLYIDGENEYITPLMIYRTMTGNPKAELTEKKAKDISDSVTKCSMTRIFIDSSEEAGAFGMERAEYEGSLLFAEKIKGSHKGEISEWIHILKTPILYQYADNKGQIARSPIELLNTPVNKNDEAIILQGYLLRRILAMQGSKLSRNIVYETVYKHLDISAASAGALRKKQTKVRDTVKKILNDWVSKKFIRTYKENKKGNSIVSLTVEF